MYIAFKILHIAAVVIFLENLVTGIFWKMHAERSGDPRIVRHTMAGLVAAYYSGARSDRNDLEALTVSAIRGSCSFSDRPIRIHA